MSQHEDENLEVSFTDEEESFELVSSGEAPPEALSFAAKIEAIIFASPKCIKPQEILELLDDTTVAMDTVEDCLDQLLAEYRNRGGGFTLEHIKGHGYQFRTVPAAGPLMERMFASRPRPISRAALETLAIVAYRQPVTRADIEFIRGVDSGSIVKNLLERDLIKCVGRKDDAGRPMMFGTTDEFLNVFRLSSLKDLPPLSAFQPNQETMQEAMKQLNGELPEDSDQEPLSSHDDFVGDAALAEAPQVSGGLLDDAPELPEELEMATEIMVDRPTLDHDDGAASMASEQQPTTRTGAQAGDPNTAFDVPDNEGGENERTDPTEQVAITDGDQLPPSSGGVDSGKAHRD